MRRTRDRGFTYLMLLWWVAIAGVMLAALSHSWSTEMRRQREAELMYRGGKIRAALQSYYDASPSGAMALPTDLRQLLEDRRGPALIRHLRQPYKDPLMPDGEWGVIRQDGAIKGVYSRSKLHPVKGLDEQATYQDIRFEVMVLVPDPAASASASASAASDVASQPARSTATLGAR